MKLIKLIYFVDYCQIAYYFISFATLRFSSLTLLSAGEKQLLSAAT